MDYLFKPIVLVTGFGPFVKHPVNASWEAVKLMNKEAIERKHDVEFITIEIPVTYENVDEFVPALWETHTPKLMIHVGVSSIAKKITIEAQAHKKGYVRLDYFDKCPAKNLCSASGGMRMKSKLDVERICKEFNDGCPCETQAVVSHDAGRYLCEYIYYTSLTVDNTRTIFIHVPDVQIYPSERTAKALEHILDLCMEQIAESEKCDTQSEKLENSTSEVKSRSSKKKKSRKNKNNCNENRNKLNDNEENLVENDDNELVETTTSEEDATEDDTP